MIGFNLLAVAATLFVAWRAEAATAAVLPAATSFVDGMLGSLQSRHAGLPGGRYGIPAVTTDVRCRTCHLCSRRRVSFRRAAPAIPHSSSGRPFRLHAAESLAGGAVRADCASRPLDPVCDPRRHLAAAGNNEISASARTGRIPASLYATAALAALAGADLRAGKELAHHLRCADVARHHLDLAAAAGPFLRWQPSSPPPSWWRGSANRVLNSRSRHHADVQLLAALGVTACRAVCFWAAATSCAATATTHRCAGGSRGNPVHGAAGRKSRHFILNGDVRTYRRRIKRGVWRRWRSGLGTFDGAAYDGGRGGGT